MHRVVFLSKSSSSSSSNFKHLNFNFLTRTIPFECRHHHRRRQHFNIFKMDNSTSSKESLIQVVENRSNVLKKIDELSDKLKLTQKVCE
jgi:hypothetical protein